MKIELKKFGNILTSRQMGKEAYLAFRPNVQNTHHPKGFSLIEVLFAMMLLSVIVFGVIKLETGNLTLSNTHNLEIRANMWANQGVQIAETLGLNALKVACPTKCTKGITEGGGNYNLQNDPDKPENGLFIRTLELTPIGIVDGTIQETVPPAPPTAYKVMSVVSWRDSTGDHKVDVKRIIF